MINDLDPSIYAIWTSMLNETETFLRRLEDDDAFEIHRIQDPARQATSFGFDGGWRALDEATIPGG